MPYVRAAKTIPYARTDVTYVLSIDGENDTQLFQIIDITDNFYTWTLASELASYGILVSDPAGSTSYRQQGKITVNLLSERNGIQSHQTMIQEVTRVGYGYNYGNNYGGEI